MWILACSCAFVAGVALTATRDPAWGVVLCPVFAYALMLTRPSRTAITMLFVCTASFVLLGSLTYQHSSSRDTDSLVSRFNESGTVELEAIVAEEPEAGGRYTKVLLDNVRVRQDGVHRPVDGRVLVTTPDPRPLHYGDSVRFVGRLETPGILGDFDYAGYLALTGVYSTAFGADMEVLAAESTRPIRARLAAANTRLAAALARILPEPEASLAQAILLGRRGSLLPSTSDAFARTGSAHLLAVSGLHLGIMIAAVLAILLATLGRRYYLYVWLGLAALWTYALFTGLKPPVVRAAIMASVFLVAELAGRQKHAPTALALAAAIMVAHDPRILWSTSFQLSVLAMGGLVTLFQPLRTILRRCSAVVESRFGPHASVGIATDIVAATLAATIAIWPVCAMTFQQFSIVGIPVSLLTLPVLPFALGASAIAAVVALFSTSLAAPFAWLAWLFLAFIVKTVESFSAFPWASIQAATAGGALLASYYGALCLTPPLWRALTVRMTDSRRRPPRSVTDPAPSRLRYALVPLLLAAALTWTALLSAPDGRLHVAFLDVGQGDCVLVQSPTGRTVLIDGGPDARSSCSQIDRYRPFWDRSIDIVIATHQHADHLGGLLTVVQRYQTGLVLEPVMEGSSLVLEEWRRRLALHGYSTTRIVAGNTIDLGDGTYLEILNPPTTPMLNTSDDSDNNAVVVRVSYGSVSFLLTSDARTEAERVLTHAYGPRLRSDVLKVGHHGSDTSSTAQFVASVEPRIAVISVGEGNAYGHPHDDVLARLTALGAQVVTTRDHGNIELVTDGVSLWIGYG